MAKRENFVFGGESILPGTRRTIDLPISVLADHTPISMSTHIVHGRREGPTVFICAGVHGDEIIGVEIVRRLLTMPNLKSLRGTLIAIPIVNSYGLLNRSRYLPDRRDLNRCFPGSEKGSLASRLAHIFMTQIVQQSDLGIDLHSAARDRINVPQIRISNDNPEAKRLAEVFGAPVVLQSQLRDGSLRGEAKNLGVDVLVYEAGEALRFDEMYIRAGVLGVLRVLHSQGMISTKGVSKAKSTPLFSSSSRWVRAPQGGLLRIYKSEGDIVAEGDVLAIVADPFGEKEQEITANLPGIIIGRTVLPIVNEGDAVYHIAHVRENADAEETIDSLANQLEDSPLFDEDEII